MRISLLALAASVAVAGCLVPVRRPDRTVRLDAARVAEVQASISTASGPARRAVILGQLAEAGLTPLADGSFQAGLDGTLVGGWIPGREPIARPSLVVVGVGADDPEASVVLEAARLLVGRSQRELVPARSVLFLVWDGTRSSLEAIEAVRRSALWPRGLVRAALVVGDVPDLEGISVSRLDARGAASVDGIMEQIVAAARRPDPEADSTQTR